MIKTELVAKISENAGITKKEADAVVETFVKKAVHEFFKKEEILRISGLGTFGIVVRSTREERNPRTGRTGKKIEIPLRKVSSFKPSKDIIKEG